MKYLLSLVILCFALKTTFIGTEGVPMFKWKDRHGYIIKIRYHTGVTQHVDIIEDVTGKIHYNVSAWRIKKIETVSCEEKEN